MLKEQIQTLNMSAAFQLAHLTQVQMHWWSVDKQMIG